MAVDSEEFVFIPLYRSIAMNDPHTQFRCFSISFCSFSFLAPNTLSTTFPFFINMNVGIACTWNSSETPCLHINVEMIHWTKIMMHCIYASNSERKKKYEYHQLIHINLDEFHVGVLCSKVLDNWVHLFARSTPCSSEIDHHL